MLRTFLSKFYLPQRGYYESQALITNHVGGCVIRKRRMPVLFSREGRLFWLSEYDGMSCRWAPWRL